MRTYAAEQKAKVRRHNKGTRHDRSRRCGGTIKVRGATEAAGAEAQRGTRRDRSRRCGGKVEVRGATEGAGAYIRSATEGALRGYAEEQKVECGATQARKIKTTNLY